MADDHETARPLYRMLLSLYPRAFRERLGESMEQTFNDLWNERKRGTERGLSGFVLWMFVETAAGIFKEQVLSITEGDAMQNIFTNPRSAAIVSLLLSLPGAILLSLLVLGIELPLGPLKPLLTTPDPVQPDVVGSLIVLVFVLLLPAAAFIINLAPIRRSVRAGNSLTANPVNLLLAVAILFIITMFVGGIIVDQYPCWIGVPNCD